MKAWLKLLRPHQYIKNSFVFVGVIFSHRWDLASLMQALWAFAAFCCTASAIYILNDIADAAADRAHPKKRHRPIAAGIITKKQAAVALVFLCVAAFLPSFLRINLSHASRWHFSHYACFSISLYFNY